MDALNLIDDLIIDTQKIISYVEGELKPMSEEVLMKRPDPKRWSVLECMEHMNISSGHYIKRLEKTIPEAIENGQPFNPEFKPGYFGDKFSTGMLPNEDGSLNNSMKTFWFFEPKKVPVKKLKAMDEFIAMNKRIIELLELSRKVDLNKNKVVSTLGPMLIFRSGDAFRFAIAHNIRHVVQIKRVIEQHNAVHHKPMV